MIHVRSSPHCGSLLSSQYISSSPSDDLHRAFDVAVRFVTTTKLSSSSASRGCVEDNQTMGLSFPTFSPLASPLSRPQRQAHWICPEDGGDKRRGLCLPGLSLLPRAHEYRGASHWMPSQVQVRLRNNKSQKGLRPLSSCAQVHIAATQDSWVPDWPRNPRPFNPRYGTDRPLLALQLQIYP